MKQLIKYKNSEKLRLGKFMKLKKNYNIKKNLYNS